MYTIYYERVVNGTMERTLLYSPTVAGDGYALIDPRLSMQINKAATLRFTMPPGHPCYSIVQPFEGNIKVYDDGERIFYGRVLSTQRDFYKKKQVICEGDLAFLNDVTIVPPYSTTENPITVKAYFEHLIDVYNSWLTSETAAYQDVARRFEYVHDECDVEGTVKVDIKAYTPVLSELQRCVKDFGGYVYTTYSLDPQDNETEITTIHYMNSIGTQRNQKIVFGQNMLDMTDFITAKDLYSVMIPTGDNVDGVPLTIRDVIGVDGLRDYDLIAKYGWVEKVINFKGIDNAQTLYNTALQRFEADIKAAQTLTFTAIDLHDLNVNTDAFRIGDKNAVVSAPHGFVPDPTTHDLTYYTLTKMELHIADPGRSTYTFGDLRQTLTGGIVNLG